MLGAICEGGDYVPPLLRHPGPSRRVPATPQTFGTKACLYVLVLLLVWDPQGEASGENREYLGALISLHPPPCTESLSWSEEVGQNWKT